MKRLIRTVFGALASLTLLAVVIAGLFGVWAWQRYDSSELTFSTLPARVTVAKGAGPLSIAAELKRKGADVPDWLLRAAFRLRGGLTGLKSGVYVFDKPVTLRGLLDRLATGQVTLEDIRFIEGWTFKQIRSLVDQNPDLAHDTRSMSEQELLKRIGATETGVEGLLFPSTYYFSPGSSDLELYRQAYKQMQKALDEAWNNRAPELPYKTPYQALVMASIVEKETGREADRTKVAAVFVNRLRRNMMLQSDPTTIYGLGESYDGNLRKRDLQTDTPFNTYTRGGLPPTPIASPGKASLLAALQPAPISALYFVARGDGTSEFSDDLGAHNRAVGRYQLKR